MKNVWISMHMRKCTRKTIREALDNPIEMDDEQIDLAIEVASEYFYAHRSTPWELAMEGAILASDVILKKIRRMWVTEETCEKLTEAIAAYDDWQAKVRA